MCNDRYHHLVILLIEKNSFYCFPCSSWALSGLDDAHPLGEDGLLHLVYFQILDSSRNTCTDTLRNNILPTTVSGHPLAQLSWCVKLTVQKSLKDCWWSWVMINCGQALWKHEFQFVWEINHYWCSLPRMPAMWDNLALKTVSVIGKLGYLGKFCM